MKARAIALIERVNERMHAIHKAVPENRPDACYWLDSDCCLSYCWECAVNARGAEFDFGMPIYDRRWGWEVTELETVFYDGIAGLHDGESDSAEACDTCGKTLSYILTDAGVEQELAYYLDNPLSEVRGDDVYVLDRLTLNVCASSSRAIIVGLAAVVNQAFRLVVSTTPRNRA